MSGDLDAAYGRGAFLTGLGGNGVWRSLGAHPALVREGRPAPTIIGLLVGVRGTVVSGCGAAW